MECELSGTPGSVLFFGFGSPSDAGLAGVSVVFLFSIGGCIRDNRMPSCFSPEGTTLSQPRVERREPCERLATLG